MICKIKKQRRQLAVRSRIRSKLISVRDTSIARATSKSFIRPRSCREHEAKTCSGRTGLSSRIEKRDIDVVGVLFLVLCTNALGNTGT